MSNIDTAYNDRVYYELQNTSIGNLPIPSDDVIGWNEDEKE